jgi:hypothetical protein
MSSLTLHCNFCPADRLQALTIGGYVEVTAQEDDPDGKDCGWTPMVLLSRDSTQWLRDGLSALLDDQALDTLTDTVSVPCALSPPDRVEASSWSDSSGHLEVCVEVYNMDFEAAVFLTAEDAARFRDFLASTLEATVR